MYQEQLGVAVVLLNNNFHIETGTARDQTRDVPVGIQPALPSEPQLRWLQHKKSWRYIWILIKKNKQTVPSGCLLDF